ncbi:ATPase AAA [Flavimobilis marinus]|nr:ATPase AAA [Flavimobilis marinus]
MARDARQIDRAAGANRRRTWTTVGAATLVPVLLAVLAIINPGVKVSQVDLNDGSVWLTNKAQQKLGRFNSQIGELDGGLASEPALDVLQAGSDVLLLENGKVTVVDPASVSATTQLSLPAGAKVAMAAGTVAVTSADGEVWVSAFDQLDSLALEPETATLTVGAGAVSAITTDGAVLTFDPTTGKAHRTEIATGAPVTTVGAQVAPAGTAVTQATAVGDDLVVLGVGMLYGEGWQTRVGNPADVVMLQHSGAANDEVLVSTPAALLGVSLDGGSVETVQDGFSGVPAAPVRVGSCEFGAWATSGQNYVRRCGQEAPQVATDPDISASDELVFRVNRSVVVLNDVTDGRLWLLAEIPQVFEPNWTDIKSQEELDESDEPSDEVETTQNLLEECSEAASAPTAQDDAIGVRPGRTTILSVLNNDNSAECGIIAISQFDAISPDFGRVESVYGGRALQLTTAAGASGEQSFTYTITDGRGLDAPSTATVRLRVRDEALNDPPEQVRTSAVEVEVGASVTYNALADFVDPDGDDLMLVGARTDGAGTVRTRPDGKLTFLADGEQLGRQAVTVQVSDGRETVEGRLNVDVRPAGSLAPVIDPIHQVAYVGQTIDVNVLAGVRSASREPVRLAGVEAVDGTTVEPDLAAGTFKFTGSRVGTYYLPFLVTATPQQATGLARIDVVERPSEALPPVAVRDMALLPPGGEVTIDPLANDTDPNGGVLVLVSAQTEDGSRLQVGVLNHRLLRISSQRALEGPEIVTYVVSNGVAETSGEVVVQPTTVSETQRPPVVQDVEVSVRTGGVVTIPVLETAYDPDGDTITLERELVEPASAGLMFVSGDVLRFQAPAEAGTARATFAVSDEFGNVSSAQVTVSVHESDPTTKEPARPVDLTARVFSGETVRITVPLIGIDDDGDGVSLLGQATAPTKGRIVAVGADYLEYESFPGETGTDEFQYAVEDWVGQRSVANVRVGIAARPTEPQPIIARNDEVTVPPGQRVEVRVLANDIEASGDELSIVEPLQVPPGLQASVEGRRIVVTTPSSEGVLQIPYSAQNARGARASAVLTVNVVSGAVIQPPIARDVVVPPLETLNKTSVDVDVLAVAENPSGPLSDLEVRVPSSHAGVAVVGANRRVTVTLGETARTVPFEIVNTHPDAEGASAFAFITVPALGDFPPVLRPNARELRVASGEELVISLEEFVQVGPGKTARVTDAEYVSATRSDGTELVVDETTLRYASEAQYAGPASITFEVTDGISREDANGRLKTLTLPITVYATEDYPPTFAPTVVEVPQGGSPVVVDLLALTQGPEGAEAGPAQYAYSLTTAVPNGFSVGLEGTLLSISAAATTARGTVGSIGLAIGYGVSGSLPATLDFRATASDRQVAQVRDFTIADGVSGESRPVEVLAGSFNPFPETPLRVLGATVETPNSGTASVEGARVVVRPVENYVGTMVVRYLVVDATGEPGREVEGRITLTVRGLPGTPSTPTERGIRDRTVVLAWDAPAANGEPIDYYEVVRSPGGDVTRCASTTCTIDDLQNDVEYSFTVRAHNAVGFGESSAPSPTYRPDAVPERPSAPTLKFGDREIDATWPVPPSPGSPVSEYTVEISPAPSAGAASVTTSSPRHTFRGLTNGTAYTVRVRAHNRAPDPSEWSPMSVPETPAAVPGAPTVEASRVDTPLGGQIQLTWTAGPDNGAEVKKYWMAVSGGGTSFEREIGGERTSWSFTEAKNGVDYTFSLRAENKAGRSQAGTARSMTWGTPGEIRDASANDAAAPDTAFGKGRVEYTWRAPADMGGFPVDRYEMDGQGSIGTSPSYTQRDLPGGEPAPRPKVRACNEHVCGPWTTLPSATPTTVPQAPAVTGGPLSWREFEFSFSARNTGGSAIKGYRYRVDAEYGGGTDGWVPAKDPKSNEKYELRFGGPTTISVQAENERGWSAVATTSFVVRSPTAPDAPRVVAESPDWNKLRWRWDAVTGEATGGATITKYEYRVQRNRETILDWREGNPDTWYTGADAGVDVQGDAEYRVEVRATNDAPNRDGSRGKTSDAGQATASVFRPPLPGRPTVDIDALAADSVTFTWANGDDHGFETTYEYRINVGRDEGDWTSVTERTVTQRIDAREDDWVVVQVRASNTRRPGEHSETGSAEQRVPRDDSEDP